MSCACKIGGGPDGVCFECKSRRAFNARLKKLEDAKASADYARGVADERARVVAALKRRAWALPKLVRQEMLTATERLERGLHAKEGA